ncbi:MAG: polymer-forming cytoskeletal protein [Deltaproteobacteria bacterium]|nr:polymer-forming cytoskeletal protein [Deltaproteobacteria bacterium]MDH4121992.1 polymer-forming cytoskeletal protein [Deltaproteobacteria bacterium]
MFGKWQLQPSDGKTHHVGFLGPGSKFKGSIQFEGSLRVDGKIEGHITAKDGVEHVLVISRDGEVKGNLTAGSVIINGRVKGHVKASHRTEVLKHGNLSGDILTDEILIQAGAVFRGRIQMLNQPPAKKTKKQSAAS